mgnify:CR=1 FL=1
MWQMAFASAAGALVSRLTVLHLNSVLNANVDWAIGSQTGWWNQHSVSAHQRQAELNFRSCEVCMDRHVFMFLVTGHAVLRGFEPSLPRSAVSPDFGRQIDTSSQNFTLSHHVTVTSKMSCQWARAVKWCSTVKLRVDAESAHPQNQNVRPKLYKKCTFLSLVVEVEETNTFTKLLNTPQSYLMPQKLFCAFEPMMRCCNRLSDSRFTLALQVIALTSVCGSWKLICLFHPIVFSKM